MDPTTLEMIGPYAVRRLVGEGAFAWVFEVVDPKFPGRRFALKMLKPEAATGEEFRRFELESHLLAPLDHPNLVMIFDVGSDESTGNLYYVMTFVEGETLSERLKRGPLPLEEAVSIFASLLDGLSRLHQNDIVHRDIKPANVLLGDDGRARLADLGVARVQSEEGRTRTGVAVGTVLYMSPEQARAREVDARSDLFSMALTLYQALTGTLLYDAVEALDSSSDAAVLMYLGGLIHNHSELELDFLDEPEVPPAIQRVISKALKLDPKDRYRDAQEMRAALLDASVQPGVEPPFRPPTRVLVAAASALALIVALGGFYFGYWRPVEQRRELTQLLDDASISSERALAVASAVKDLNPEPSAALMEEVDHQLERVDSYLQDVAEDIESGSYGVARKNLDRAGEYQRTACRTLVDGFLIARVNADVERFQHHVGDLADQGAEEIAATSWPRLASLLPQLTETRTAGTDCEVAEHHTARLEVAAAALPLVEAVQNDLDEKWPKLVDEVYQQAVTARMLAQAEAVPALEYRLALKDGKRQLAYGSRHLKHREYASAREAYRAAERGFATASLIAPAALARSEASALIETITVENPAALESAQQLLYRGGVAYEAGDWSDATELFRAALADLRERRRASELRRPVLTARQEAIDQRDASRSDGALLSAPTEYAQAESTFSEAEAEFAAGDLVAAERSFLSARDEFGSARKRAIQALREAELEQVAVQEAGQRSLGTARCDELAATDARAECEKALESFESGRAALIALDGPGAIRNFLVAREAYVRAEAARVLWEKTRPRPPELVRRVPQRAQVRIARKQRQSFAVEAKDPNGDVLHYRWSIDGRDQAEEGPTLRLRPEESCVVAVRMDDGRGGELTETWDVEVVERTAETQILD
jgi:serine/threonine protein kinase